MERISTNSVLHIATIAAREAGKIINQHITLLDRIKIMQKDQFDIVTEIDYLAEEVIIKELLKTQGDFNIVTEESAPTRNNSAYTWIIDPLDGTINFSHGQPHCAVSIALQHESDTILAVIYDPFRNELFTAKKGQGAQLDGKRIRVSDTQRLRDSLCITGFPHPKHSSTKDWLKSYALIMPRCQGIHISGASVLDLAYIACGRYDAGWSYGVKIWDIAAASLLIQEAGGFVHSHTLNKSNVADYFINASNALLNERFTTLLSKNK